MTGVVTLASVVAAGEGEGLATGEGEGLVTGEGDGLATGEGEGLGDDSVLVVDSVLAVTVPWDEPGVNTGVGLEMPESMVRLNRPPDGLFALAVRVHVVGRPLLRLLTVILLLEGTGTVTADRNRTSCQ